MATSAASNVASSFAAKGHNKTLYWADHNVVGHGVMQPDIHGSLDRYLTGSSVGNLQGERVNVTVLEDFVRHPNGLALGPDYKITDEDVDDVKFIDVDGVPAYTWIEREALRLGIDPRGDQAPKPAAPDSKARAALLAIKEAADKTRKPVAAGGGIPARELRKLLAVIETETARAL